MKRRNFLKLFGIGTAAAAVPAISFASVNFGDSVIRLLKNDLHYLTLDETGLEKFALDYGKEVPETEKLKIRLMYMFGYTSKSSYSIEKISRQFLLGSNFFRNGMDESKTVVYTALYSPYTTPCGNPFSNLYYPEKII